MSFMTELSRNFAASALLDCRRNFTHASVVFAEIRRAEIIRQGGGFTKLYKELDLRAVFYISF